MTDRSTTVDHAPTLLLEALEPRLALSGTPLPDVSMLETATNPVIRFETTYGDVDFELYADDAPITVANFLTYVNTGRLDETFFHRMISQSGQIGILQGGGFLYDNLAGVTQPTADAPIVLETTNRSNIERTIAMARTNDPNSATSQFFINTTDNSSALDPTGPNTGYAVFGGVIQGWDVIQQIFALDIINAQTEDPAWAGSLSSVFTTLPVTEQYTQSSGIRESSLVYVINAELIKPAGTNGFFTREMVFPEGNATATSTETVELFNPNAEEATYQLIAHYEDGVRDSIISTGTIPANSTLTLPISVAGQATGRLVRADTPYSLVLQTSVPTTVTTPQPVVATAHRRDFGAETSESFFDTTTATATELRTWDFSRIERNSQSREFLLWQSLTDESATITVTFYTQGASPQSFTFTLDAYRRGGVEVFSLGLADGVYSARISSTKPIVAALSDFDLPAAGVTGAASTPAWAVLGTHAGGASKGVISGAEVLNGFTSTVSVFNPSNAGAIVRLKFWRTSRPTGDAPIQQFAITAANNRTDFVIDAAALGLADGETFSITYEVSSGSRVSVQYTSVDETNRGQATTSPRDGLSTMFTNAAPTSTAYFTDAFLDPTHDLNQQVLTLSLFSPFARVGSSSSYSVTALFSDGTSIAVASGSLEAEARVDLAINTITDVLNKVSTGPEFRRFSLLVTGSTTGTASGDVSAFAFAQLTRRDSILGAFTTTTAALTATGLPYATDPAFGA